MSAPGTLHVVATPLGNLEDVTFRAVRVLGQVHLIAAEDTRRTRKLLSYYGLKTRLVSYREQNHAQVLPRLLKTLSQGRDLALVSDAGTPGVSDPGAALVREASRQGAPVVPVPGPSAPACALSVSGLPGPGFVLVGFLPPRKKARTKALNQLRPEPRTMIFFEAPHRLREFLAEAARVLGPRPAVLGREMTKRHEEFLRGSLADLAEKAAHWPGRVRGEITLVVAGAPGRATEKLSREELALIIQGDPRPVREIVAELAPAAELSRSELYRLALEVTGRKG